ncbi:hypothetical protein Tco_0979535 [Tanacetum coccineum]
MASHYLSHNCIIFTLDLVMQAQVKPKRDFFISGGLRPCEERDFTKTSITWATGLRFRTRKSKLATRRTSCSAAKFANIMYCQSLPPPLSPPYAKLMIMDLKEYGYQSRRGIRVRILKKWTKSKQKRTKPDTRKKEREKPRQKCAFIKKNPRRARKLQKKIPKPDKGTNGR